MALGGFGPVLGKGNVPVLSADAVCGIPEGLDVFDQATHRVADAHLLPVGLFDSSDDRF